MLEGVGPVRGHEHRSTERLGDGSRPAAAGSPARDRPFTPFAAPVGPSEADAGDRISPQMQMTKASAASPTAAPKGAEGAELRDRPALAARDGAVLEKPVPTGLSHETPTAAHLRGDETARPSEREEAHGAHDAAAATEARGGDRPATPDAAHAATAASAHSPDTHRAHEPAERDKPDGAHPAVSAHGTDAPSAAAALLAEDEPGAEALPAEAGLPASAEPAPDSAARAAHAGHERQPGLEVRTASAETQHGPGDAATDPPHDRDAVEHPGAVRVQALRDGAHAARVASEHRANAATRAGGSGAKVGESARVDPQAIAAPASRRPHAPAPVPAEARTTPGASLPHAVPIGRAAATHHGLADHEMHLSAARNSAIRETIALIRGESTPIGSPQPVVDAALGELRHIRTEAAARVAESGHDRETAIREAVRVASLSLEVVERAGVPSAMVAALAEQLERIRSLELVEDDAERLAIIAAQNAAPRIVEGAVGFPETTIGALKSRRAADADGDPEAEERRRSRDRGWDALRRMRERGEGILPRAP